MKLIRITALFCFFSTLSANVNVFQGQLARSDQYLSTVALKTEIHLDSYCAGAIIAPNYILTTAKCILRELKVVIFKTDANAQEFAYPVLQSVLHPNYNPVTLSYNVAIIQLHSPIAGAQPLLLANIQGKDEKIGQKCTALGTGVTPTGQRSFPLLQVELELIGNNDCDHYMKTAFHQVYGNVYDPNSRVIDDSMMCSLSRYGEGMCSYDEGGPLIRYVPLDTVRVYPVLVGVTSFRVEGIGNCGKIGYPDAFGRVSMVQKFVDTYSSGHQWHTGTVVVPKDDANMHSYSTLLLCLLYVLQLNFN